MKIQKIIFSCSEPPAYSSYWNIQSRLWRRLEIEPICLLFGKKSNTDMSESHGTVIELETLPDLQWSFQMVWSKFDFTRSEPDTTWIIIAERQKGNSYQYFEVANTGSGLTYLESKSYAIWEARARVCIGGQIRITNWWVIKQLDYEYLPQYRYLVYNSSDPGHDWSVTGFANAVATGGKYILEWLTEQVVEVALTSSLLWAADEAEKNYILSEVAATRPPDSTEGNQVPVGNNAGWEGATVGFVDGAPQFTDGGTPP